LSQDHEHAASASIETPAAVGELQEQLAAVSRERDQLRSAAAEKAELLKRIDGLSRERDELSASASALAAARDAAVADASGLKSALDAATGRAETAEAARAQLQAALDAKAGDDPLGLLWLAISQLTARGVAWLRGKIPEGHAALPWFDKAVETSQQVGCLAVRGARAFIVWAAPRAKALAERLMTEVEARLAKK
jgi:hypothetical protein